MPRRTSVWGRTRKYMYWIQKHAGSEGLIESHYDGQWDITHHQLGGPDNTADQFVQNCLQNWRNHWHTLPALERLHNPGYALKDDEGEVPSLAEFHAEPEVYLKALIDRVVEHHMSPKWKKLIDEIGFPANCEARWGTNALGIRYRVAGGSQRHTLSMPSRDAAGLCIPYNARALPPHKSEKRKRPWLRHHLHSNQFSGYLYVYLGTDANGHAVQESVHRIITLGHRGEREDNQEVSHACHNPWCLSPRCMDWKTHKENMREKKPKLHWSDVEDEDE